MFNAGRRNTADSSDRPTRGSGRRGDNYPAGSRDAGEQHSAGSNTGSRGSQDAPLTRSKKSQVNDPENELLEGFSTFALDLLDCNNEDDGFFDDSVSCIRANHDELEGERPARWRKTARRALRAGDADLARRLFQQARLIELAQSPESEDLERYLKRPNYVSRFIAQTYKSYMDEAEEAEEDGNLTRDSKEVKQTWAWFLRYIHDHKSDAGDPRDNETKQTENTARPSSNKREQLAFRSKDRLGTGLPVDSSDTNRVSQRQFDKQPSLDQAPSPRYRDPDPVEYNRTQRSERRQAPYGDPEFGLEGEGRRNRLVPINERGGHGDQGSRYEHVSGHRRPGVEPRIYDNSDVDRYPPPEPPRRPRNDLAPPVSSKATPYDPNRRLPEVLQQFIALKGLEACRKFHEDNEEELDWVDLDPMQTLARDWLRQGRKDIAERVVERLIILRETRSALEGGQEYLKRLTVVKVRQDKLRQDRDRIIEVFENVLTEAGYPAAQQDPQGQRAPYYSKT